MTNPVERKIVGHKTLQDGSHVPLYEDEANALMAAVDAAQEDRAKRMPDEQSAIKAMFQAWYRLKEMGWSEAMYCPKDGSAFQVIEAGSTGIFECRYRGKWPTGSFDVYNHNDIWPSHPVLFKRYPKEQAEHAAKMAAAAAIYADNTQHSPEEGTA